MATTQLNEREQLIELILHLPDEQITVLAKIAEKLVEDPNWTDEGITAAELVRRNQIDQAAIDAVRDEPTRPLEDVLHDLGIA